MSDNISSNIADNQENNTIEQMQQKHQLQISLIEKKHTDTVLSLIRSYERQLKEKQLLYEKTLGESDSLQHDAVSKLEKQLKGSLTWRIGWAQTSSFVLLVNFLKNPFLFITDQRYRWKNLYYFPSEVKDREEPVQQSSPKEIGSSVKKEEELNAVIDPGKLTLMCVFDTFTRTCFAPEFNIVAPTPGNWKKGFDQYSIDAVFIESAWHGNNNSWDTLTTNFGGLNKLETMKNLISTARSKGIPAIFWNKEDPVHFNGFIDTAKMMDFVFTSDAESIPKYQEHISHRHIYALPFAAQHKIHNPVRDTDRSKTVSFAGSYYNFSFAERKLDLDILLKPAMSFGLEIYDRNFGATGLAAEEYKFPDLYKPAIRGKLEYSEMLKAYKSYKVFLNVNSVKYSSTMFARRVFELMACGTPVITNYSKGIVNLLGEENVFITESETDTNNYLEKLLGDEHFWWKRSLQGMRKVMEHHTYEDRSNEIFTLTGHAFRKSDPLSILVVAPVSSVAEAQYVTDLAGAQQLAPAGIVFIPLPDSSFTAQQKEDIRNLPSLLRTALTDACTDQAIRESVSAFTHSHVAIFSPEHYYGKNYLRDANLAVKYSDARIVGKKECVILTGEGKVRIPALHADYRWVDNVPAPTLLIDKLLLQGLDLATVVTAPEFSTQQAEILSLDPFNFLTGGGAVYKQSRTILADQIGI